MFEKLEELVKEINSCEEKLVGVESEVKNIEKENLNKAISIALKGLKFDKIYSSKKTYNQNGNRYFPSEIEYFTKDDDSYLRGIVVDIIELKDSNFGTGSSSQYKQLFLLSDGTFKVFNYNKEISFYQGEWNEYSRYEIENEGLEQFKYDNIIENIMDALKERLDDLGNRTKSQRLRLEKLDKLQIK